MKKLSITVRALVRFSFLIILLTYNPLRAMAKDFFLLSQALSKLDIDELGGSTEWKRILLYHPNFFGSEVSLIDSPSFFLHPLGKSSPKLELKAFIDAVISELEREENTLRCRFPRRTRWLEKKMKYKGLFDPMLCRKKWRLYSPSLNNVSFVFSSYFLESPASFFGHLFLHFGKNNGGPLYNSSLDPVVNFSAIHGNVDFFSYFIGGLSGWFPGVFEVLPMHFKIQQYGNHESRDLWEYPLKFDQEETHDLIFSIEEMSGQYSYYYYLSRNCSFLLGKLIESVKPEVKLGVGYRIWSTPVGVLQDITNKVGDGEQVEYHPSNRSRYMMRYELLSEREKEEFSLILSGEKSDGLNVKVIDALIEYIDFYNRLAAAAQPKEHGELRRKLLLTRAKIDEQAIALEKIPLRENPLNMKPEKMLGFGALQQHGDWLPLIEWHPTLKSLISSSNGFKSGMGMTMFGGKLVKLKNGIDLLRFNFLNVENYQRNLPFKRFINLNFRLSYGHFDELLTEGKGVELDFGANQTYSIMNQLLFMRMHALLQEGPKKSSKEAVILRPGLGFLFDVFDYTKLYFLYEKRFDFSTKISHKDVISVRYGLSFTKDMEFNAESLWLDKELSNQLSFRFYF